MNCWFNSSHLHANPPSPHVGINTSIQNILLCNIVINCTRTYHTVASLLGVTTTQMSCMATRGKREKQCTVMELPNTVLLSSLTLRQKQLRACHEWLAVLLSIQSLPVTEVTACLPWMTVAVLLSIVSNTRSNCACLPRILFPRCHVLTWQIWRTAVHRHNGAIAKASANHRLWRTSNPQLLRHNFFSKHLRQ